MKLKQLGAALVGVAMLCSTLRSPGFVLMGPIEVAETAAFNYVDDLGAPKDIHQQIKRFYRWNMPSFVYSFDASFVGYFGTEGMNAVHEAFGAVNNFFVNEDYKGVSALDLAKHGYVGNYNTTWVNTTAQNSQVIDIKSVVLGLVVNHLGLGNPHRHAFSITGTTTNATGSTLNFHVRLRNYDPVSSQATDTINNVKYSYRLIHDLQTITVGGAVVVPAVADMEEFTSDQSGNAFTSVAAIADAFYGGTALFWTDTPTVFNFGVYYDGMNAMGGQFSPRHALTYDDAGGLKYLYNKQNYIYEAVDIANVVLVQPAQYLPTYMQTMLLNPTGQQFPFFPRQGVGGGALPGAIPITTPIAGTPGLPGVPLAMQDNALRGGIDQIQFYHQPYDSLLGNLFTTTNFVWNDTFLWQAATNNVIGISDASGNQVGSINAATKGITWNSLNPNLNGASFWQSPGRSYEFKTQKVGRSVTAPDLVFVADAIPAAVDGVPVGWTRETPVGVNAFLTTGTNYAGVQSANTATNGPGVFTLPPAGGAAGGRFTYTFHKTTDDFEVLWSGEASMVGNMAKLPSLWGHIKGPGPSDVVTFPRGNTQALIENSIIPDTSAPTITLVSDSGGAAPIEASTLTRTEEVLTIVGGEMASVTAIDVMSGDLVVQTIFPVDKYIVSNSRIDVPAGMISDASEGADRQVRVWNSAGASTKSTQKFKIETGRPVITSTDADGQAFDRAQTLTVRGYGFKSKTTGELLVALIRVDGSTSEAKYDAGSAVSSSAASTGVPQSVSGIEVLSDTQLVLPINAIGNLRADGPSRRLRVARKTATAPNVDSVLSPATNPLFLAVTTKPVITTLTQKTDAGWENIVGTSPTAMFKRDRILEINGTALNTLTTIEVVQQDGTSFANPIFIQLPNAAVTVEENGTRIQVAASAFTSADADTNSTIKRGFKLYNAVATNDLNASAQFAVNTQPVVDAIGGFANAGYFNRDKTVGDDLMIFGSGFKAVSTIYLREDNINNELVTIVLPSPGVTVTDTQIAVDTQQFQIGGGADTSVANATRRIINLSSARANATSPLAQRFYVGAPPTIDATTPVSAGLAADDYLRTQGTATLLTLAGTGFGHLTTFEIVDINGNTIVGLPGLLTTTGANIVSTTNLSADGNASGWSLSTHLLDSVVANSRRVRVTTPFGKVTSSATPASGAFTISARPAFLATAQATFAGGGYSGGTNVYDKSEGDLYINGTNFRGVNQIVLESVAGTAQLTLAVDPSNPPAGVSFSADGTRIIIDDALLPAALNTGTVVIRLKSASGWGADTNGTTITVQD